MVLVVSDPQYQTFNLNFLGSYSLVGIGKFNLVFLWLIGGASVRCTLSPDADKQAGLCGKDPTQQGL